MNTLYTSVDRRLVIRLPYSTRRGLRELPPEGRVLHAVYAFVCLRPSVGFATQACNREISVATGVPLRLVRRQLKHHARRGDIRLLNVWDMRRAICLPTCKADEKFSYAFFEEWYMRPRWVSSSETCQPSYRRIKVAFERLKDNPFEFPFRRTFVPQHMLTRAEVRRVTSKLDLSETDRSTLERDLLVEIRRSRALAYEDGLKVEVPHARMVLEEKVRARLVGSRSTEENVRDAMTWTSYGLNWALASPELVALDRSERAERAVENLLREKWPYVEEQLWKREWAAQSLESKLRDLGWPRAMIGSPFGRSNRS